MTPISHRELLVAAGFLLFSNGCGTGSSHGATSDGAALRIDAMVPSEIPADYSGSIVLSGGGFNGATFTANNESIASVPGAHLTINSDTLATIDVTYAGAGQEIPIGHYQISATDSTGSVNAPEVLHVRTFLAKVDFVRTKASGFTVNGGTLDLYIRPRDFMDRLMSPGSALVTTNGLAASNFNWSTTLIEPLGSTTTLPTGTNVIADASFQFVGEIGSTPLAISMAIDQSGSMHSGPGGGSDPTDERITQAEAFVNTLGATDIATIYSFQGTTVTMVSDYTSDKAALVAALETLRTGSGGGTPLYNAQAAIVSAAGAMPAGEYVRAAVVLTDGVDNGSTVTPAAVVTSAQNLDIPVFSIGLGDPTNPASLDPVTMQVIADQTGGSVFLAADASALGSVFNQLEGVLDSSYHVKTNITFSTPLPAAGSYSLGGTLQTTIDYHSAGVTIPTVTISALP